MGNPLHLAMGIVAGYASLIGLAAGLLIHLMIGFALNGDANQMRGRLGSGPFFFGPVGWFFLGLAGGVVALALYWAMHYSTLRSRE